MERLGQLELMCERLYNARDHDERSAAEQALQSFSMNADYIPECQFILDNSNSPYAQHLASSSLIKQVSSHSLTPELKSNISKFLISMFWEEYFFSFNMEERNFRSTIILLFIWNVFFFRELRAHISCQQRSWNTVICLFFIDPTLVPLNKACLVGRWQAKGNCCRSF